MSPQLDDGYTKIANAILENASKYKMNGTQFRILMVVWRSTYGWNKKDFKLSETYLANATDINKKQIQRELKVMIEMGILTEVEKPTYTTPRVIGFNKRYLISGEGANPLPGSEKEVWEGANPLPGEGANPLPKKDILKDKIKEKRIGVDYADIFDHYNSVGLIKHKRLTEEMKKGIDLAVKTLGCDTEEMKRMIDRHKEKSVAMKDNDKFKIRPLAEFFGQKKYQSVALICSDYSDDVYNSSTHQTTIDTAQFKDDNPFNNRGAL